MPKLLLLYSTEEGQTRRIAEYIRDVVQRTNWAVDLRDVRGLGTFGGDADALLLAASIHVGRHSPLVQKFVTEHRALLADIPCAFISVSLSAAGERRAAAEGYLADFLEQTGWQPQMTAVAAGALRYREYGVVKRMLMKQLARSQGLPTDTSRDHEYTHWGDLKAFVLRFLDAAAAAPAAPAAV